MANIGSTSLWHETAASVKSTTVRHGIPTAVTELQHYGIGQWQILDLHHYGMRQLQVLNLQQ